MHTAENLLAEIDRVLGGIDVAFDKPLAAAPDPALLKELLDTCKAFDMDGTDAVMERLEAFRYESGGDFIARLREQVNDTALREIARMELPDFQNPPPPAAGVLAFTALAAKILIAEDNGTNLQAALALQKPIGMRIDTAENGVEALRMIRENTYHLVLMDCMMSVMDGIEAVERLRRTEGAYCQSLPVIALTAREEAGAREDLVRRIYPRSTALT